MRGGGFAIAGVICGALGWLAVASTWPDVLRIKGPGWFGDEALARVVDAGVFNDQYWTDDNKLVFYDEVRARYQFEVDGTTYEYAYNDGYAHVPVSEASADYIRVVYLPGDPKRNHPASMTWVAEDEVFGLSIGVVLLQLALLFVGIPLRSLFLGEHPD